MIHCGIFTAIPLKGTSSRKTPELFTVGFGKNLPITPIDLLTAIEPKGVVCFFSALEIYNLTTQMPSHHNICILTESKGNNSRRFQPTQKPPASSHRSRNPIGTLVFEHDSLPYYSNRRKQSLVPGVTERFMSSKNRYHITTVEQTLLDTLQHPFPCGGPEVIFEVWEKEDNINQNALQELLITIDNNALCRRVGAMFDLFKYQCKNDLAVLLEKSRSQIESETLSLPLLAGMNYSTLDHKWKILVP